ncbi:MAG: hypothetical protein NTU48_01225 [Legionellales bacterium]|nr:hypothetical protein [Legionellales bacterium]
MKSKKNIKSKKNLSNAKQNSSVASPILSKRTLIYVPMLIGLYIVMSRLFPFGPNLIGHDYVPGVFLFLFGRDYFWKNGFAIPHYIASLCGGVPYFANPQSVYYSLPQLLTFFMDPFIAFKISIVSYYLIGYFSMLYLLRACLQFIPDAYVPRLVRGIQTI